MTKVRRFKKYLKLFVTWGYKDAFVQLLHRGRYYKTFMVTIYGFSLLGKAGKACQGSNTLAYYKNP